NPGIAFVRAKRGGFPNLFVFPTDEDTLEDAEQFTVVKANAVAAKKKYRMSNDYEYDELYSDIQASIDPMYKIRKMRSYPGIFKIINVESKARLFKFLTTDLKMPEGVFKSHIGSIPEDLGTHGKKFHNAMVFFPDSASKRTINSSIKMLEAVFQHLNNHGLGFVFGCAIRFTELPGKTAGQYYYESDEMRIGKIATVSGMVVRTILHEFVHRLYYKFLDDAQRKAIDDKFSELFHEKQLRFSNDYRKATMQALMNQVKPGTLIDYVGRKRSLQSYGP
ncbi:unnamed protein product, partial [marine sediment metagenome]